MQIVENVKSYLAKRAIKKSLLGVEREVAFPNYKDVKSILLLFVSDDNEKNVFVRNIISKFREEGKKVVAWGYVDKKEPETAILPDFRLFAKSELTKYGIPTEVLADEIQNGTYDMTIQLVMGENFALDYLLIKANSTFKVAPLKSLKGIADFMIDLPEDSDEEYLYKQILHYLKSIHAKK